MNTAPTIESLLLLTDRELDVQAAIAAGWRRYRFSPSTKRGSENLCWLDYPKKRVGLYGVRGVVIRAADDLPFYADGTDKVPRFSTNPTQAVALADSVLGKWWEVRSPFLSAEQIARMKSYDGENHYWAGFTPLGTTGFNGRMDIRGHAPTFAKALTIAATRALLEPDGMDP